MASVRNKKKSDDAKTQARLEQIAEQLKATPEQELVVGPLVNHLCENGWKLGQIVFGKREWRIPKSPSEQTKRERRASFAGFPVDIAVFDEPKNVGDPRHLIFIIECKQPTETAGITQLEAYFVGEPHVRLGVWANNSDPNAVTAFIYRKRDGSMLLKRGRVADLPRPGEAIRPETQQLTFRDLIPPTEQIFKKTIEDLLDKVVIDDSDVTRREEQLDQLCNVLLLKLESDKQGKSRPSSPIFFRPMESAHRTARTIRDRYRSFVELYPDTFTKIADCVLLMKPSLPVWMLYPVCGLLT